VGTVLVLVAGCSVATPDTAPVGRSSLAPSGAVGYVVCPDAVTPVELATHTAEAPIPLPVTGQPELGDFAIATSSDGRWAYVVTSDGSEATPGTGSAAVGPAVSPASTAAPTTASTPPSGVRVQNVVIPVDLVTQRAGRPIDIPGQGGTHAIVVLPGNRTVLASSGSTVVAVDVATRRPAPPLDLGPGRTIFGLALDPAAPTVYALVAGGVVPVDTTRDTAGVEIPTGLSISSVYSPHGIAISADGATVYVAGQGGANFGGRLLPIATATGTALAPASFDRFGIADPAAVALDPSAASVLLADGANDWVNTVALADFADPPDPAPLPRLPGTATASGTQHPTDIVVGPGRVGAFVVAGFHTVLPFDPTSGSFGHPIPVCSGASSMTVAVAP
jgi:hypothetical protein